MEKPAILGGPAAVTSDQKDINKWPFLGREEEEAVIEILRDGDLSLHPVTKKLEADYKTYFERKHALAHCNGTAALLAAYFSLHLQPGDEVLVPSATHWASVVPMLWVGLVPVFCESEQTYLGLNPEDAEKKITSRTKAMAIVHLLGMPSQMDALLALAKKYHLKIIEDASHAHGASWRGKKCGTFGDVAVFSLQTSKLAPAGEGGMLLTDHDAYIERAICLGDIYRILELETPAQRFAGTSFGMKTRIAPISAAIARCQFQKLEEHNRRRNKNIMYLSEKLERLGLITFLPPAHVSRVYFEFMIKYPLEKFVLSREFLVKALAAEGCQVELPRYPLLHQMPLFTEGHFAGIARAPSVNQTYGQDALPKTEEGQQQLLKLPLFTAASQELLDQYAQAFEKVIAYQSEIKLFLEQYTEEQ